MTLLVLLFVISSYVVIPWWAWALGWLKVSLYIAVVIQQVMEKLKQQRIMKENERYITELANQYVNAARAAVEGHGRVGMPPPDKMN